MAYLYGLLAQEDLAGQRVTEIGVDEVMRDVERTLAEHTRQVNAAMSLFVTPTTEFKTRFQQAAAFRLQPMDDRGRALPVKPSGYYDVAWPIQGGASAWGYNYIASQKITMEEVSRVVAGHTEADIRWMRDHILAALFYKSSTNPWTFVDPLRGSLSIYGLANGDSVTYDILAGASGQDTDDHLLFDAAADADTFVTIYNELTEHPENGGDVVAFIPTNLKSTIEALATFYPIEDPDLRPGSGSTVLTGRLGVPVPGGEKSILGKIEKVWIVEWKHLPDSYIVATTTEGERPLAMRQDPEPSLQGFKLVAERNDYPWYERQFLRRAGFGAWNRVNALVMKIAGSYAIPTGYDSPLA